jgi:hypothetical protein
MNLISSRGLGRDLHLTTGGVTKCCGHIYFKTTLVTLITVSVERRTLNEVDFREIRK